MLNCSGISPVSSLLLRLRYSKLERLPNSLGISPLSWLLYSVSSYKLERLPNSLGILPVSWLWFRLSFCKLDRLPNSFGILPLSLLLFWESSVILSFTTVTPYQLSTTEASGGVKLLKSHSLQPVLLFQLVPSVPS